MSDTAAENPASTTIVAAQVHGEVVDVRIQDALVVAVQRDLPHRHTRLVHAEGAALLPGLHDHHLHLLAMAARDTSLDLDTAAGPSDFDRALRAAHHDAPPDAWLRVTGYGDHHGPPRPERLERLAPRRRVRVQHRSGAAWLLSPMALATAGREPSTEWIFRDDEDLREVWAGDATTPDLGRVGRRLASWGVTGVTDATPFDDPGGFDLIAAARADRALPQRVMVTGGTALSSVVPPSAVEQGPVKVVVTDHSLPSPDDLAGAIRRAHDDGRGVALHCVSRAALVLALVAWEQAGSAPGDRIEHGSVIPAELIAAVGDLGLTVVTQPGFIAARGDDYLRDVEADDLEHLYRCASLEQGGVRVAGSTDAPYGPADPWVAMRAAVERVAPSGALVGAQERVSPVRALELFLGPLERPADPPRRVEPGMRSDLCLLDVPLRAGLEDLSSTHVRATWVGGDLVHGDF